MRDSYLQLKEQYSNLFKENQRLKDAGHTYEGTHEFLGECLDMNSQDAFYSDCLAEKVE